MSRSPLFANVHRALRIARLCEVRRLSTEEGMSLAARAAASGTPHPA